MNDEINIYVSDFPYCEINNKKRINNSTTLSLDGSKCKFNPQLLKDIKWEMIKFPENNDSLINDCNKLETFIDNLIEGEYIFKLSINYNNNNSSSDIYNVIIKTNPYPIASISE